MVKQADEVVMVDLTPRALLNRLERGVVYPPERAQAALQNFFKESTLVALRELAMRQTAHAVESRQADEDAAIASPASGGLDEHERLLLLIGPDPASAALIRRGRRVADYLRAECLAVYVSKAPGLSHLTDAERTSLERQLNFARGLQIETRVLEGDDEAETAGELRATESGDADLRDAPQRSRALVLPRARPRAADGQPRAGHAGHGRRRPIEPAVERVMTIRGSRARDQDRSPSGRQSLAWGVR